MEKDPLSLIIKEFWKGYNVLYGVKENVIHVKCLNSNSGGITLSKQLKC
jgi:hypothetical protein